MSDSDGAEIASQVNVWWDHRNRISTAKYEVGINCDPYLLLSHGESLFRFLCVDSSVIAIVFEMTPWKQLSLRKLT